MNKLEKMYEIQYNVVNLEVKSPYFKQGIYNAFVSGYGDNTIESKKQLVLNIEDLIDRLNSEKEKLNIEISRLK